MGRILRTQQATDDLLELWIHIAAQTTDARANALIRTIDKKLHLLAAQPELGRPRSELRAGLRAFPVKPYVIFYLPLTDGITVIRVLHGRRDIEGIFNEDGE